MKSLCNLKNVVNQGIIFPKENIKTKNTKKTYIEISSTKGKLRFITTFIRSHKHLKNQTALSKYFLKLKNKGLTPEIQWSILKSSNTPTIIKKVQYSELIWE